MTIKLVNVQATRGSFTLELGSLALGPGVVGVVGPNGAGKTTLFQLLAGELELTTGSILLSDVPLAEYGYRLPDMIGFSPDDLRGPDEITVAELFSLLESAMCTWDSDYVSYMVGRLHVETGATLGTLSRGTRQKISFIATEAPRPPYILLDEPTAGLDPFMRSAFLQLVDEARKANPERTMVLATHLLEDLATLADSLILLSGGNVVRVLSAEELEQWRTAPTPPRLAAYLGELGVFS